MPRIFKYMAYLAAFALSYALFLYWVFPYNALRDRILGEIEQQIGGGVQVSAKSLEPYWITGVEVEGLSVEGPGPSGLVPLIKVKRATARAALVPLIFGSRRVTFDVRMPKGSVYGYAKIGDETTSLEIEVDDLDLSSIPLIKERTGLTIPSRISGEARLELNRQQPVRSTGEITMALRDIRIAQSSLNLGDISLDVPELVLAKGKDSRIRISVGKGAATLEQFTFSGGDLGIDLKGKVFLAAAVDNYRLNLKGGFTASDKLGEALPFLFIVNSQKQEDGSYPLSITGKLGRPSIKIGTFTVPL
ncbi:MAG: type II secretion system protein GspN [Proteobacteria bacterium]|nr:type II secretion system protein GspN [Pseudomonadota bacterium]